MAKTKRNNSRLYKLPLPHFKYTVRVVVCDNFDISLKKWLPDCSHRTDENTDAFVIEFKNRALSYVFLKPNSDIGTVVHESWHLIKGLVDFIIADIDDEFVAYHLQYVVEQILLMLKQYRKKHGKKK